MPLNATVIQDNLHGFHKQPAYAISGKLNSREMRITPIWQVIIEMAGIDQYSVDIKYDKIGLTSCNNIWLDKHFFFNYNGYCLDDDQGGGREPYCGIYG